MTHSNHLWQPIETAPKDERVIMAVRRQNTGEWYVGEGRWWPRLVDDNVTWWHLDYHPHDCGEPTHWQPLPPPPEDLHQRQES